MLRVRPACLHIFVLLAVAQAGVLQQWASSVSHCTSSWAGVLNANPVTCMHCSGPNDLLGHVDVRLVRCRGGCTRSIWEGPYCWTGTAGSPNTSGQPQLMCSWHALDGWRPAPGRLSDFAELSFDVSVTAQLIEVWEGALPDTLQPPPSLQPQAPPMIPQQGSGLTRVEVGDGTGGWVAYQLAPAPAANDGGDGDQGGGFGQGCIKTLARPPTGVAGARVKLVRLYIAPPTPTTAVVVQGVRMTGGTDPAPAPPPAAPGGGSSRPNQHHSPPPLSPVHPPPRPLPPMVPSVAVGAGVLNGGRAGGKGGGSRSTSRLLPAVIVPSTVALVIALAAAAYWARQRKRNKGGASALIGRGFGGRPQPGSPLLDGVQGSSNGGEGGGGGTPSTSLHHHWPGVVGGQGGVGAHGGAMHPHTSSHQRRQNALRPSPYAADEPLLLIPSQDLLRGAEGHNRGASIVRRTSGVEGSASSQSSSTPSVARASGSILLPLPPMP